MPIGNKNGKPRIWPSTVFRYILEHYPNIHARNIEFFTPIYYPIAVVEMELIEKSFEDLSVFKLTILELIKLGITSPVLISETIGLSPRFVETMIGQLETEGFIDDNGAIRELGRESLQESQIIFHEKQQFKIDGLNGKLIAIEEDISERTIVDVGELEYNVDMLERIESVEEDDIKQMIIKNGFESYMDNAEGIIHENTVNIPDIEFKEMKYAKGYMLKLTGEYDPMVFYNRSFFDKTNSRRINTWIPFGVTDESLILKYGFDSSTCINSSFAANTLKNRYEQYYDEALSIERNGQITEGKILEPVTGMYKYLDETHLSVPIVSSSSPIDIIAEEGFLKSYNFGVLDFLSDIGMFGFSPIVLSSLYDKTKLCGRFFSLVFRDKYLEVLSKRVAAFLYAPDSDKYVQKKKLDEKVNARLESERDVMKAIEAALIDCEREGQKR